MNVFSGGLLDSRCSSSSLAFVKFSFYDTFSQIRGPIFKQVKLILICTLCWSVLGISKDWKCKEAFGSQDRVIAAENFQPTVLYIVKCV